MSDRIEMDGERVIESEYLKSLGGQVIHAMHLATYDFARQYCVSKTVLDLGCGSGYGTARLAACASRITGVDVSAAAVAYASQQYEAKNLVFQEINAGAPLPFPDMSFDTVLSFQVIEHVANAKRYLEEARRVLRPNGYMVLVTPDRKHRLLPGQRPWNRWHLYEYSQQTLVKLVETVFEVESVLGMGASDEMARIELARYRRIKWLTLPVTLPFMPEPFRRKGLDALHAVAERLKKPATDAATEKVFDESGVHFSVAEPRSLNLAVVAKRRMA